jgi:cell division protein FtsQ
MKPEEAEKKLQSLYMVASVGVSKYYPDRLVINLEGRKALALSLGPLEGHTVPVVLDREGVVIEAGLIPGAGGAGNNGKNSVEEKLKKLPIISGLVFEDPVPGVRIPVIFRRLLEELENIEKESPDLLAAFSEMRIVRKSFDGFEIILYPVGHRVKVRVGPELNEDLLRYTLLMVDVIGGENSRVKADIDTLDFRTGMASYLPRGSLAKEAASER